MTGAKTPILHGVAQGDFDMAGYRLLNVDLSTLASGAPFSDATALIKGSVDTTKLARFEIDGFDTGTLRVFTLPNYNGVLATIDDLPDIADIIFSSNAVGEFAPTFYVGGNLSFDVGFTLTGADVTLDAPAGANLTLPASGTLAVVTQIPVISDVAYNDISWNASLDGATKNVLRDKFESIISLSSQPFDDDKPLLFNNLDPTKLLKFSLAGLTTATTRTLTVQDKDGTIACLDDLPDYAGILFSADQPDRQLHLGGNVGFFGPFTFFGGFLTTIEVTGITDVVLPLSGTLATRAGAETLTNKIINGGQAINLSALSIIPSVPGTAGAVLQILANTSLTSSRTLTLALGDVNRTLTLGGNLSTASNFSTVGNFALTLTQTGATNVTLPTTGLLASKVGVPASSTAPGALGQWAADPAGSYLYIVCDLNKWGRVALDFLY